MLLVDSCFCVWGDGVAFVISFGFGGKYLTSVSYSGIFRVLND